MRNIVQELRVLGEAEFEGVMLRYEGEWWDLKPGDTYIAERNTGPKLLTVALVKERLGVHGQYPGAVYPVEIAYPFDLHECVKVEIVL